MKQAKLWRWCPLIFLLIGCAPPLAAVQPLDECRGGKPSPRKADSVVVLGEVQSPRRIPWRCGLTASEAIAAAGGFSTFASPGKTMITRNSPQGKLRFEVEDARRLDMLILSQGDVVVAQASGLGLSLGN